MGKLLSESLLLTYKNETFDVETLIGRYHANIYSENECIQIVEDPVNNPVIWIFAVLRYDFQFRKRTETIQDGLQTNQMVLCEECNTMSR